MKDGAFALIDCLGFKGIWKNVDPKMLLKKLLTIEQIVKSEITLNQLSFENATFGPIKTSVRLLSDTVAISHQYEDQKDKSPSESQKNFLVSVICVSVIKVLDLFIKDEPPLVLRGCITYGEHLIEGGFIVGPAVDIAAEYMHIPDGAFIWLHPTAAARYKDFLENMSALLSNLPPEPFAKVLSDPRFEKEFSGIKAKIAKYGIEGVTEAFGKAAREITSAPFTISSYDMPLKSNANLKCTIINPLAMHTSLQKRHAIIKRYSQVMVGDTIDIWLKQQNTMAMLEKADQLSAQFSEVIERMKSSNSLK